MRCTMIQFAAAITGSAAPTGEGVCAQAKRTALARAAVSTDSVKAFL